MGISVHVFNPERHCSVAEFSISHNYRELAMFLGIYELLWQTVREPAERCEPLFRDALRKIVSEPESCRDKLKTQWDSVEDFCETIKELHYICMVNPEYQLLAYG